MGDKYTVAQKNASIKYLKEKTDSIQIRTQKGTKERWKGAAAAHRKSLNQFIVDAVETEIERDDAVPAASEGHTEGAADGG